MANPTQQMLPPTRHYYGYSAILGLVGQNMVAVLHNAVHVLFI